jgi:cysteine desulfurase/selenocysteine lyase
MLDAEKLKKDFPIFSRKINGRRLVYLDSAATTQKPLSVIEALSHFYRTSNANIHRGAYLLAQEATEQYEAARAHVARFIHAPSPDTIVFTRNTTESINLVAYSWARSTLKPGDEILLSEMEHHANLIPWQLAAQATGAALKFIPLGQDETLDLSTLNPLIGPRTRLVAVSGMSNTLGVMPPLETMIQAAHQVGARILIDAAQLAPHKSIDVTALGCDFLAFSAHKMLGPTGVGVLYARRDLLDAMPPFNGGGEMIRQVWLDHATWNEPPHKFEAGTPNIADVVAFSTALDYLEKIGMKNMEAHEQDLIRYTLEKLEGLPGLRVYGPKDPAQRGGVISFTHAEIHAHDLATILDREGVAIRAGHHCNQPLMRKLGVAATARASFYLYNTREDVDALVGALLEANKVFGVKV